MSDPTPHGSLGRLEAAVMRAVWRLGEARVPDVRRQLEWERPLAYTTVMTVLGRLVQKGLLARRKEGRFFVYTPRVERAKVARAALRSVVDRFFDGMGGLAVAQLLADDAEIGEPELAELERLIQQRRGERG